MCQVVKQIWPMKSAEPLIFYALFSSTYHVGCKFYFTTSLMISYLFSGKLYDKYVLLTINNHLYANLHSALIKDLIAVRESGIHPNINLLKGYWNS